LKDVYYESGRINMHNDLITNKELVRSKYEKSKRFKLFLNMLKNPKSKQAKFLVFLFTIYIISSVISIVSVSFDLPPGTYMLFWIPLGVIAFCISKTLDIVEKEIVRILWKDEFEVKKLKNKDISASYMIFKFLMQKIEKIPLKEIERLVRWNKLHLSSSKVMIFGFGFFSGLAVNFVFELLKDRSLIEIVIILSLLAVVFFVINLFRILFNLKKYREIEINLYLEKLLLDN
jgi:hypothetical protein